MGIINEKEACIFETQASWSYANKNLLCLQTGEWRTERPIVDTQICNACGICITYCPPQCMVDDGEFYKANLEFCKGCGVCAKECPKGAITMKSEGDYANECPSKE